MSRLRQILVEANPKVAQEALQDVLFLCGITHSSRQAILKALKANATQVKIEIEHNDQGANEVPSLFRSLAVTVSKSQNIHYQIAIIVWYMLFDAELFGANMLRGETDAFKDQFMKGLKEATAQFIAGRHMTGRLFRFVPSKKASDPEPDNPNDRKTGHYIAWLRDYFAIL